MIFGVRHWLRPRRARVNWLLTVWSWSHSYPRNDRTDNEGNSGNYLVVLDGGNAGYRNEAGLSRTQLLVTERFLEIIFVTKLRLDLWGLFTVLQKSQIWYRYFGEMCCRAESDPAFTGTSKKRNRLGWINLINISNTATFEGEPQIERTKRKDDEEIKEKKGEKNQTKRESNQIKLSLAFNVLSGTENKQNHQIRNSQTDVAYVYLFSPQQFNWQVLNSI